MKMKPFYARSKDDDDTIVSCLIAELEPCVIHTIGTIRRLTNAQCR